MRTLVLFGVMTLVGYGLLGREVGGERDASAAPVVEVGAPAPSPAVSTNEGGCWDTCKKCEEQCRQKTGDARRSCDESCWKTNDTCCQGVGGKGVYKMCGCTDK